MVGSSGDVFLDVPRWCPRRASSGTPGMEPLSGSGRPSRSRSTSPAPVSRSTPATPATPSKWGSESTAPSSTGGGVAASSTPSRPRRRRSPRGGGGGAPAAWRHRSDLDAAATLRQRRDSGDEPYSAADDDESTTPLVGAGADVDEVDHLEPAEAARVREAAETVQSKIARCKEAIKQQQRVRDENVNEYLIQTATVQDRAQLQKLKALFEKKNQKAAQQMAHQQRKLEAYTRRAKDLETSGLPYRPPKEMLKDVGQGLRAVVGNMKGGIQGAAESVMSKPREIAHLLKNKFGSADNITALTNDSSEGTPTRSHHGSSTLPPGIPSSVVSGNTSVGQLRSEEGSDISSAASDAGALGGAASPRHQASVSSAGGGGGGGGGGPPDGAGLISELWERKEECDRLREDVDTIKATLQQEITLLSQALQEERFRYDRLEQQMNDFIELHQNEVENLRQHMHDMEEKVQYQSEERVRDIHEMMDKCNTRISRMEHQQVEHQQLVNIEVIGNSQARALVVKLVNIVLTVLQVVLLIVATLANITMPFLRTRVRTLSTVLLIVIIVFVVRQWGDFSDLFHHYVNYVRTVSAGQTGLTGSAPSPGPSQQTSQ
ncbi:Transmembrane and coiled-coil domains protein 1 [Amphibalanus amphitrite]|uniref:Transmembrane and coiled-coil domains protein 1 n=1 Tax=Amphibalanus amphitrite TaxID=1232801 RepID=A0A6A4VQM0_AMPAM|nr:Transmembrane and coiled-coil domains protein 1 [Amphibalanus amphitrite]